MQVLSRRVAASAFISKYKGARPWAQGSGPATSPSPSPSPSMQQLPPTDKQLAFAETLAEQHNVELPAEAAGGRVGIEYSHHREAAQPLDEVTR